MAKKKTTTSEVDIASLLDKIDDLATVYDITVDSPEAEEAPSQENASSPESVFGDAQMEEIKLGETMSVRTQIYAKPCYNWMQMREIRKGLAANLNTALYDNPNFSAQQMREIRLGLADGLDAGSYAKLLLSATDMHNARITLFCKAYKENPKRYGKTVTDEERGITLRISDDYLKAFLTLTEYAYTALEEEDLLNFLHDNDIRETILKLNIDKMLKEKPCNKEICVAEGKAPTSAKEGWFELFFDNPLDKGRIVAPEDEIDYSEVRLIDMVDAGTDLIVYHPVKKGRDGMTVSGLAIRKSPPPELPTLTGIGFSYNPKTRTYTSTGSGYPSYNASTGSLTVCMVYEVRGDLSYYQNMQYDGTVHIHGSVLNHATIQATGDVIVDGHMENAFIFSDQNIVIKGGVNGGGTGTLSAGGSIKGKFFEYTSLKANGSIEGNYFLDCRITTDDHLIVKGKKARIMGGSITAAVGVEAVSIGNYLSNKTVINVGDVYDIDSRILNTQYRRNSILDEVNQLKAGLQKLVLIFGEEVAATNALYTKTAAALEIKQEQLDKIDQELERLNVVMRRAQKGAIRVHGEIQEDVSLIINGFRKKLSQPLRRNLIIDKYVINSDTFK